MKIATVAACPVFGGKLATFDDSKAKAIKGCSPGGAAPTMPGVIAEDMWAAEQGLAALDIHWNEGPTPHSAAPILFSNSKRLRWGQA